MTETIECTNSIYSDYFEVYTTILNAIGIDGPLNEMTHEQFLGKCYLNFIKATWYQESEGVYIYHFNEVRGAKEMSKKIDDSILKVDYNTGIATLIAAPRPMLGYISGSLIPEDKCIITWPIIDGTTFRLYNTGNKWIMSSRSSVMINNAKLFDHTFEELFFRLSGVNSETINNKYDKDTVYTFAMSTVENCPYKNTTDKLLLLEECKLLGVSLVTTLHKSETLIGEFGHVYRTENGVYLDTTKKYRELVNAVYNIEHSIINELTKELEVTNGTVRKVYAICRAIMTSNDKYFLSLFPKWKTDHGYILSFINSLVRQTYNLCMTRTRGNVKGVNSYASPQSLVGHLAELIGPLRTSNGLFIVQDTLYNNKYISLVAAEYIRNLNSALKK